MMTSISRSFLPRHFLVGVQRIYVDIIGQSRRHITGRLPHRLSFHSVVPEAVRADNPMPTEAKEYWNTILEDIDNPTALNLMSQLDLDDVTGLQKKMTRSPPCLDFFIEMKKKYPEKILLVQVGDFYEAIGHDAVLLVSECALKPMAPQSGTPRAGCPLVNLPRTLYRLVNQCQFSVVVCDEYDPPPGMIIKNTKLRKVKRIYNPGEQGFSDEIDCFLPTQIVSPNVALFWESSGFGMLEFRLDRFCILVNKHLTEDALWGQLSAKSISAPVCIHPSFASKLPEWRSLIRKVAPQVAGRIHSLDGGGEKVVDEFRQFLKLHHGYSQEQEIYIQEQEVEGKSMRSPSFSTASQLGLTELPGIPNIIDCLVPRDAVVAVKAWFKDLLLVPKSLTTVQAIHSSLRLIPDLPDSLPLLRTYLSPGKVAKTLQEESAPVNFFRKLYSLLDDVQSMFSTSSLKNLSQSVLPIIQEEQGVFLELDSFHLQVSQCKKEIEDVVELEIQEEIPEEEDQVFKDFPESTPKKTLNDFFELCETFYGMVQEKHLVKELKQLKRSKENLIVVVYSTLDKIQSLNADLSSRPQASLCREKSPPNLFLNCSTTLMKHPNINSINLTQYFRQNDKKKDTQKKKYTTLELTNAIEAYKLDCSKVMAKVTECLEDLRKELNRQSGVLLAACSFSLTLQSLIQHSWEAQIREWNLPDISNALKKDNTGELQVSEMWPYWMEKERETTVKNDLLLREMVLLTGPNMAGKSTIMRSFVASCLLALSGLYVPAERMLCPFIDHIVLRSFSGDHPLDKQSGFSMEMNEMNMVLESTTAHSLVLLDELGKGTEVKTGSGITGSFLEYFSELGCRGIVSTHLHLMKKMPLKLQRITFMKMDTKMIKMDTAESEDITNSIPTHIPQWTITHGYNLESLGIQVAKNCGLHQRVISQAYHYQQSLTQNSTIATKLDSAWSGNSSNNSTAVPIAEALIEEETEEQIDLEKKTENLMDPDQKTEEQLDVKMKTKEQLNVEKKTEDLMDPIKKTIGLSADKADLPIKKLLISVCQEKGLGVEENQPIKVYYVKDGQTPPPLTARRSCLYVYRRSSGHHYVGESDNLKSRLQYHRRKKRLPGWSRSFETWYVCIPKPQGAKSMGRQLETALIKSMIDKGYIMESSSDSRNRSFGTRD